MSAQDSNVIYTTHKFFYKIAPWIIYGTVLLLLFVKTFLLSDSALQASLNDKPIAIFGIKILSQANVGAIFDFFTSQAMAVYWLLIMPIFFIVTASTARIEIRPDNKYLLVQWAFRKRNNKYFIFADYIGYRIYAKNIINLTKFINRRNEEVFFANIWGPKKVKQFEAILCNYHLQSQETSLSKPITVQLAKQDDPNTEEKVAYDLSYAGIFETLIKNKKSSLKVVIITLSAIAVLIGISFVISYFMYQSVPRS